MHQFQSKNYNIGYTRTKSIKKNKSSKTRTFFRKIPIKKGKKKQYRHNSVKIHNTGKYGRKG